MNPAIQHPKANNLLHTAHAGYWSRFIKWAAGQEENRFFWLALGVAGHGCAFTIITILTVMFTGNHFVFWPIVIGAMAMTLVSNLAAMPTRITIPIFFLSLLIDLGVIISAVAMS